MPAFRYEFSVQFESDHFFFFFLAFLSTKGGQEGERTLLEQRVTASFDANDRLNRFKPISPLHVSHIANVVFIFATIVCVLVKPLVQHVSKDKWWTEDCDKFR